MFPRRVLSCVLLVVLAGCGASASVRTARTNSCGYAYMVHLGVTDEPSAVCAGDLPSQPLPSGLVAASPSRSRSHMSGALVPGDVGPWRGPEESTRSSRP